MQRLVRGRVIDQVADATPQSILRLHSKFTGRSRVLIAVSTWQDFDNLPVADTAIVLHAGSAVG